jgi:RNA polymerase sigma factor (sigma-70 family)
MQTVTDDILLVQLKTGDNASFQLLYRFYFPSVASYVKQNMGNREDAEDIFQEAILVLLQRVRQPDFILTSALKTYLYAIAKNLWLKRLRKIKLILVGEPLHDLSESETFSVEINPEKTKEEKITNWLTKITANCQRILKAIFYYQEPVASLMKIMRWKNKHTAANQQYKCIQQVKREMEKEEKV